MSIGTFKNRCRYRVLSIDCSERPVPMRIIAFMDPPDLKGPTWWIVINGHQVGVPFFSGDIMNMKVFILNAALQAYMLGYTQSKKTEQCCEGFLPVSLTNKMEFAREGMEVLMAGKIMMILTRWDRKARVKRLPAERDKCYHSMWRYSIYDAYYWTKERKIILGKAIRFQPEYNRGQTDDETAVQGEVAKIMQRFKKMRAA